MSIIGWGKILQITKTLIKYQESGYLESFCKAHALDYHFIKKYLNTNLAIISGDSELVEAIKADKELAKKLNDIYSSFELT